MPTTTHSTLADAELHEPKGAAGASINTTYVSDGAGSGTWKEAPNKVVLSCTIDDISTADTVYIPAGVSGTIDKIYTSIDGAIGTADATITTKINTVAVTGGTVTVAYSGSAAGDVDSATPSAANTITAGDSITVETDGASTGTVKVQVQLVIKLNYS